MSTGQHRCLVSTPLFRKLNQRLAHHQKQIPPEPPLLLCLLLVKLPIGVVRKIDKEFLRRCEKISKHFYKNIEPSFWKNLGEHQTSATSDSFSTPQFRSWVLHCWPGRWPPECFGFHWFRARNCNTDAMATRPTSSFHIWFEIGIITNLARILAFVVNNAPRSGNDNNWQ